MKIRLTVLVLGLVLTGCPFPIGDAVLGVRGQIENTHQEAYGTCVLRLHLETGEVPPYQNQFVERSFDTSFIVEPRTREYFLSIECDGSEEVFKTPKFKFVPPFQEIDLGVIQF
ncbi:MAG: hypothetical protein OEU25_14175 [Rhodospirillales bacterium]|nr:hypothetical protein [Rhodospirillales bacterium]